MQAMNPCLLMPIIHIHLGQRLTPPPLCSRSRNGSVISYPLVETVHKDNICHVTEAPANVPGSVASAARYEMVVWASQNHLLPGFHLSFSCFN
jgi:hypothetical protein